MTSEGNDGPLASAPVRRPTLHAPARVRVKLRRQDLAFSLSFAALLI